MIADLLKQKNMSVYKCSKISGIPYTTLLELVNNKTSITKISAETLYSLSKALDIPMGELFEMNRIEDFSTFTSNAKHRLKAMGDLPFIYDVYEKKLIDHYWDNNEKDKALYLLAMVDFLSRINELPLANDYDKHRKYSFKDPILPPDMRLMSKLELENAVVGGTIEGCIPEFKNFNIIEGDLRDVE